MSDSIKINFYENLPTGLAVRACFTSRVGALGALLGWSVGIKAWAHCLLGADTCIKRSVLLVAFVDTTSAGTLKLRDTGSTTLHFRSYWDQLSFHFARCPRDVRRTSIGAVKQLRETFPGAIVACTNGRVKAIITAERFESILSDTCQGD